MLGGAKTSQLGGGDLGVFFQNRSKSGLCGLGGRKSGLGNLGGTWLKEYINLNFFMILIY